MRQLTAEERDILALYEDRLRTVMSSSPYWRMVGRGVLLKFAEIYKELTGKTAKIGCYSCVVEMLKILAESYFAPEVPESEPQTAKAKKAKR